MILSYDCQDHCKRMAWRYKWCSKCSKAIPPPLKWTDSWGWPNLKRWGLIIPPAEREKMLHKIHEGHQGISKCQYRARHCVYWPGINQDIKCTVMCNMPMTQTTGTMATTQTNTSARITMAAYQCWLLFVWWIWIPSYCWLLFQDTICKENASITVQCQQNHISAERTVLWIWIPDIEIRQWSPICQPHVHWICQGVELWPQH